MNASDLIRMGFVTRQFSKEEQSFVYRLENEGDKELIIFDTELPDLTQTQLLNRFYYAGKGNSSSEQPVSGKELELSVRGFNR